MLMKITLLTLLISLLVASVATVAVGIVISRGMKARGGKLLFAGHFAWCLALLVENILHVDLNDGVLDMPVVIPEVTVWLHCGASVLLLIGWAWVCGWLLVNRKKRFVVGEGPSGTGEKEVADGN